MQSVLEKLKEMNEIETLKLCLVYISEHQSLKDISDWIKTVITKQNMTAKMQEPQPSQNHEHSPTSNQSGNDLGIHFSKTDSAASSASSKESDDKNTHSQNPTFEIKGKYSKLLQDIPPPLSQARNQHNKTYDFFVTSSNKDARWVFHSLLPKCETQYGFKGCISDRDFLLGKDTLDNIFDSISDSTCAIIVITPDFIESNFCNLELDKLVEYLTRNKCKLVPIKLKDCEMPEKVSHLTYMDSTECMDWERLRRALEEYCCAG